MKYYIFLITLLLTIGTYAIASNDDCNNRCGDTGGGSTSQEQGQEQSAEAGAASKSKSKAKSKSKSVALSGSVSGASSTSGDSSATGGDSGASAGSSSQAGDNSVTVEGSTNSYEHNEAANRAAMAVGADCVDGTTGQAKRFGFGISRANPVCEQLMMYKIFLARGDTERAENALDNAEDLAGIRAFGRGFLTVISLGIL